MPFIKAIKKAKFYNSICNNPNMEYKAVGSKLNHDDANQSLSYVGQYYKGELVGVALA